MRPCLILLFALMLPFGAAMAAQERHDVFADVVVSPEGRITEFSVDAKFEGMEAKLREIASVWRFKPWIEAGQPAQVHTTLWLRLHLDRSAEGATARLEYLGNGPNVVRTMRPRFPADALREGASGIVMLLVSHDALGKVTDVQVKDSRATRQKDRKAFEVAATQAARGWVLRPQQVNGVGVPSRAQVPVWFDNYGRDPMPVLPPSPVPPPVVEDGLLLLTIDTLPAEPAEPAPAG